VQTLFKNIKGDRLIWAIAALLAIFSFLPVYSAASNLAYIGGSGNTFGFFYKALNASFFRVHHYVWRA
jgi:cell division protein FtsW